MNRDPQHDMVVDPDLTLRADVSHRRLSRHYAEMVLAMLLGMMLLYLPFAWILRSTVGAGMDAAMLGAMPASMTVSMAAWMRRRGHARRAVLEMAATMVVPGVAAFALYASALVADVHALMAAEHAVMLASMAAVMVLRRGAFGPVHGPATAGTG